MNSIQTLLTDHLDIWTSALLTKSTAGRGSNGKLEAYGIKRLRALILELAVRGKLLPQDPNDEQAIVLLEKIAKEKTRLIREGLLKKEKLLPDIGNEEKTFELPLGWKWVRFGTIAQHNSGKTLDGGRNTGQLRDYITTSNLYWGRFDLVNIRQMPITDDELGKCTARKGDLLICEGGESGRAAVWPYDHEVCFQNHVHRARFYGEEIDPYFVYRFFEKLNATGEIDQHRKGVGISNMSSKALALIVLPLPPFAEQHRIVAKVDELMALCDQLEQQQTHSIEAHQTLVETLLGTLTRVESQQEFSAAWARIASHFDTLFTSEASIDQLKQTILQLAVMGKLVPQDPNDEDVQILLTRNDLRRRDVAESDRRADVDSQKILSANDRWGIPESWCWRGLADLALFVDYRGKTPTKQSSGIRLLTAKNVRQGQIDLMPEEFLTEQEYKDWMTRGLPKVGDVLFTTEAPMGNAAVVELTEQFALAQRVICFQNYGALAPAFLVMQILSNQFQSVLDKNGTGMTAKGIKASKLKQLPIAIPPLVEQHRIVAKVDELMYLCDTLKARLADAQAIQLHLADAIVEQAVC